MVEVLAAFSLATDQRTFAVLLQEPLTHPLDYQEAGTIEKITSQDGTTIGFQRSGSGQPLLLVHGSSANHRRWAKVLPQFESHFTVYAMDRRGRGASADSPEYDLMREAEDVAAVVEAACQHHDAPVSLLGHSFGAICSLEAVLLTSRVDRLVLYEPPLPTGLAMYPPGFPERMKTLLASGDFEAVLLMHMREIVKMPEHELEIYRSLPMWKERIQIAPTLIREIEFDQTYRFDAEKFARLQVPTLLLLGGDSPPLFRQATEVLAAALPNSQVTIFPGQQHIAIDTAPDLFTKEVLQFLQAQ